MNEKYNDNDEEINTNSNQNINNNKNNINSNPNTYNSTYEKSIISEHNTLLNSDIPFPSSNSPNYIQSSIPNISSLQNNKIEKIKEINKINEINDINIINEINKINENQILEKQKSIIDKLNDSIDRKLNLDIQNLSIIPIGTLKDNTISPDCNLGLSILPSTLLSEIMFIEPNYILSPLLNIRKSCFRSLSVEDIMTWDKKELNEPLLRMEDDYDKEISIQMFRNLLSYMKDRESKKKPISHISKIIRMVKHSSPIVKDEAYLQVYKQLHNNNKRESYMRGWKFLAMLSSCFVPNNKDIYYLILNFLFFELKNAKDEPVQKHINYIFMHMVKTHKNERKNMPCTEELEYIELLKSIPIPIYFFNGKQIIVRIEPYTTFKEIKLKIMNMLDFNQQRAIFYSIYEICYKNDGTEERFIDDNEIIGDVISLWKSDVEKYKQKKEIILFRFYLKLLIYYSYDETNIDNLSIDYYQSLYDVISGKFILEEQDILILAGLQLVNQFGPECEKAYIYLKDNYEQYIPGNKLSLMSKDQFIEKIIELYTMFSYYSKNECKIEYIKVLKENQIFHTHQFDSKFNEFKSSDNDDNIPQNCILGFQPEGIIVLNMDREKVVFYEYVTIKNWGISKNSLVMCIGYDNKKLRRLYFNTGETNVIQTLMEIYVSLIAGLSHKDIKTIIEERDNKFSKNTQTRRVATKYTRETEYENIDKRKTTTAIKRVLSSSFYIPVLPDDKKYYDEDDKEL